ncbi:heterokaryon incompatibility protein-domain-containing protein [Xylaria grammica]|nr:heterokaryon incompatibility protein-domain-containing protein [Xylaria grammica]
MAKLVEPSSWPNPKRYSEYACLSYCWGEFIPECITTKASYDENMRGISSKKLPRTFSDAVTFCRAIGFRYLWIDSCCIIQDDPSDWNARAPEMHGIYKNSTLTVAATASQSGEGGCFQKLDEKYRERPLQLSTDSREKLGLAVEAKLWTRLIFPHNLSDMPLLRRGWVYQERLLSPRIVHFTANELMWECRGEILCSCSENGVFPASEDPRYGPPVKKKHFWAKGLLKSIFLMRESLQKRWYETVQEYTSLALSFGKDKLPALAGLAKEMEISLRESSASLCYADTLYINGLWRDTFLDDMIWFVDSPENIQQMPAQWRSPSWSWASVDSPISYPQRPSIEEKFLPLPELALSTDIPTSTYIVLTGKAAVAVLACENGASAAGIPAYVVKVSRQTHPVFLDYHRFGPRSTSRVDLYENAYCLELGSFAGSGIRYFLLLARTRNLKPDSWTNEDLAAELELWRHRSNSEPKLVRRIGLAVVCPDNDFLQSFQQSLCEETFIVV